MAITLVIIGCVIIFCLAGYAYSLTRKVREVEKEKAQKLQAEQEKQAKQKAFIIESLNVISANVIDEDLNLSEATIRCKRLLDGLILDEQARLPFKELDVVFDKIQDFATHKARKALPKHEREAQDKARVEIENQHRDALLVCFRELRTFAID